MYLERPFLQQNILCLTGHFLPVLSRENAFTNTPRSMPTSPRRYWRKTAFKCSEIEQFRRVNWAFPPPKQPVKNTPNPVKKSLKIASSFVKFVREIGIGYHSQRREVAKRESLSISVPILQQPGRIQGTFRAGSSFNLLQARTGHISPLFPQDVPNMRRDTDSKHMPIHCT